ncbi:MAG: HDOD domain-containing protein [Planctomycetes bacterium]|nr:HDOD domain-containing protein [Planctomycetota bacterium]
MIATKTRELIKSNLVLPTLPRSALRIRDRCLDPGSDATELADAIALDPSIAARMLKNANSACFGQYAKISSIHQAVVLLGHSAIYNLVLQVELFSEFTNRAGGWIELEKVWRHSILTAQICREIALGYTPASTTEHVAPDDAYACGLLHDLGKIVLFAKYRDVYAELLMQCGRSENVCNEAERRMFGFTHSEVGAMIAHDWGFPDDLAFAIEAHHAPRVSMRDRPAVIIVSLADEVSLMTEAGSRFDATTFRVTPAFGYLHLSHSTVEQLFQKAAVFMRDVG